LIVILHKKKNQKTETLGELCMAFAEGICYNMTIRIIDDIMERHRVMTS
jgi:hypothetical protein